MIDHLLGRPSISWKRTQVFLVIIFWCWRLQVGNPRGPFFLKRVNRILRTYQPWQLILSTLITLYGLRNADSILGLNPPEPLAKIYSPSYFRATWIVTALDAGFATCMYIKPKIFRDILSLVSTGYFLLYANQADEVLRRHRAHCTVDMLRVTWEKSTNPFIRFFTKRDRPRINMRRRMVIPRPAGSKYKKPVICWLYYDGTELELIECKDLVLDIPGGGFVSMNPLHHEDRILRWALKTRKPVLSVDYRKAPEYPYPYAIDECVDLYRVLVQSRGSQIGMGCNKINIVLTGDSAGANIGTAVIYRLLELEPSHRLPLPVALVYAYPALDFDFHAWMTSQDLATLRAEGPTHMGSNLLRTKDHMRHKSPLSVVDEDGNGEAEQDREGWTRSLRRSISRLSFKPSPLTPLEPKKSTSSISGSTMIGTASSSSGKPKFEMGTPPTTDADVDLDEGEESSASADESDNDARPSDPNRSMDERIKFWDGKKGQRPSLRRDSTQIGTRLTMTSRTSFFNDRIIAPAMMRTMALCYVGAKSSPDLTNDYMVSPILADARLLEQLPPVYIICGERDPVVDDTILFAAKIHQAKAQRRARALAKMNRKGDLPRMADDIILEQCEDDWAVTRIYSGWSHGFLQMIALMPEAEDAILLLADYIDQAFERNEEQSRRKARKMAMTSRSPSVSDDEGTVKHNKRRNILVPKRPAIKATVFDHDFPRSLSTPHDTNTDVVPPHSSNSSPSPSHQMSPTMHAQSLISSLSSSISAAANMNNGESSFMDPQDVLKKRREDALLSIAAEGREEEVPKKASTPTFTSRRGSHNSQGSDFIEKDALLKKRRADANDWVIAKGEDQSHSE